MEAYRFSRLNNVVPDLVGQMHALWNQPLLFRQDRDGADHASDGLVERVDLRQKE